MLLPCTLTYPVVAEVPGEDGRSKGAGRIHPCASVIYLQETQLELRQHPSLCFSPYSPHVTLHIEVALEFHLGTDLCIRTARFYP